MISIRSERPEDYPSVYEVNKRSFESPAEASLVDILRPISKQIISLVAVSNEKVVGHVFFTPVSILDTSHAVVAMGLGPMAVAPEYQKQGIGSQLIDEGLKACQEKGAQAVFVLGHPEFYTRFGFQLAHEKGLRYKSTEYDPYFFLIELKPGALRGISGYVSYMPEFDDV